VVADYTEEMGEEGNRIGIGVDLAALDLDCNDEISDDHPPCGPSIDNVGSYLLIVWTSHFLLGFLPNYLNTDPFCSDI